MESSEEDDDFPSIESITPQSKIDSLYQDAVENLCGDMQTKYLAFLRISEEVVEMEHELVELRKHISAQGILVQDLMTGDNRKAILLENFDVLLAEHKVEEAIEALEAEEKNCPELKGPGDTSSMELSSYRSEFLKRRSMLEDQLIEITEQPVVSILELKKALSALIKLGKGPLAHQLLLKSYGSRLQKSIELFLPSCSVYPKTFPATLSRLLFSIISVTTKESGLIFGDNPENAPSSETVFALGAASNCVQASLTYSSMLESQDSVLVDSGMKFMDIIEDILAQLTPMTVLHFGANILTRISQLFDKYMDMLIKSLPSPSDDDNLTELKENESKELESENIVLNASITAELKEWKRSLQHSFDKLRDHFCYSSSPTADFSPKALFAKLQQLATVAGDVLLGKEKIQKILLARLTETVMMWLSEEQEFWDVFEDESVPLCPLGLQQLIFDMHFTVEIAHFAGYPSRHVHQIASAIIARAIRTFSARGIDPQSALPEDEWFVETAKTAINKLLLGPSGSDTSEIDEDHSIIHDEIVSDSDETASSSLSSIESFKSFASANMGELDSPMYFTNPDG
ncbi:hypothetical protein OIU84_007365 [Salix udensis]|uniref:Exocyst component Exo84 C-terminal domain-containing protein n=1 Tax=Salix udensis TaxID=889485 RepID=A0AAD6JU88_9ROSI|nr:hypothetical protein OIU84_007365 [Salix udensis]